MGILDIQKKMVAFANCILFNDCCNCQSHGWQHFCFPTIVYIILTKI